jgi:predicted MPP superfamily phosphohydrolase
MRVKPQRILVVLLVWAMLTGVSAWVHVQLWSDYRVWPLPEARDAGVLVRGAGAVSHVLTAPGWAIVHVASGNWLTYSITGALCASGAGWALWLVVVFAIARVRHAIGDSQRKRRAEGEPCDRSRRAMMVDGVLALGAATGAGTLADAAWREPWRLRVRRYRLPIADLPASLEGVRFAQVCDTHLGPHIPESFVREALALALSLKPDAFLLVGDYIHDGIQHIEPAATLFAPIVATGKPVLGVLGNHDWYASGERSRRALDRVGVRMIDHTRVYLDAGTRQISDSPVEGVCIAGFGDLLEDHIDVDRALGGVPHETPRLVLSHNPDAAEIVGGGAPWRSLARFRNKQSIVLDSSRGTTRIDAMLSGHTHGGQIAIPGFGPFITSSRFGVKYEGGVVQGPRFPVVVSRGVGMSILPVRFCVPPEIVELTLTRA